MMRNQPPGFRWLVGGFALAATMAFGFQYRSSDEPTDLILGVLCLVVAGYWLIFDREPVADDVAADDFHGDDFHGDDFHGDDFHGDDVVADYLADDYLAGDYAAGDRLSVDGKAVADLRRDHRDPDSSR